MLGIFEGRKEEKVRKTEKEKGIVKPPLQITETLENYIQAFNQYYFLTSKQLTKAMGYKPSMYTNVKPRLYDLVEEKYLQVVRLPTVDGKGPYIYTLAHKGVKYLRELGQEVEVTYRPSNIAELNHSWLKHLLELNDFLICAKQVGDGKSGFRLYRMWHDLMLKRNPIKAPVSLMATTEAEKKSKRMKDVVPDGVLVFRKEQEGKKTLQYSVWIEHDRGTEGRKTIMDKVRAIVAAILSGAVKEYFDIPKIENVCFITSAGSDRVETLRKWTMEALASLHVKSGMRDLFVFSCFPYAIDQKTNKIILHELDYEEVFFQPVWRMALKYERLDVKPLELVEIPPIALIELD